MIELANRINGILWKDWDPIGAEVLEDEYASYAMEIYTKYMGRELTRDNLVDYLLFIESNSMGLPPRPEAASAVAAKLFALFGNTN